MPDATLKGASLTPVAKPCAVTGKSLTVATLPTGQPNMNAWAAETPDMVPSTATRLNCVQALTPYKPEAWQKWLSTANLTPQYPSIYNGLHFGFHANIPHLSQTLILPNSLSIKEHNLIFKDIVNKELGRYLGPFTQSEVKCILGLFQTSPLSLISKPGKYWLVQNLSFPLSASPVPSINSLINPDCTTDYSV